MEKFILNGSTILITGATGSFGTACIDYLLKNYSIKKIIIYSRDEHKQYELGKKFPFDNIRYFIGNVRDYKRLYKAFKNVDYVIHAAALKHVHVCEYNPFEAVKTNIYGSQNVIDAAIERNVKKVVSLSTDKAANPISLYGGTKFVSDRLFQSAENYSNTTQFSVVRSGNIAGSRGSVIPFFKELKNEFPINDFEMTRFWIDPQQIVKFVIRALQQSMGGEIFIPKIPSFKVIDLAKAFNKNAILKQVGIKKGEKIHEDLIVQAEAHITYKFDDYYMIKSGIESNFGNTVKKNFSYTSKNNKKWLSVEDLRKKLRQLK